MRLLLKRIFFGLPFFVLIILIALTFFQHPQGDDFTGIYLTKNMGLWGATQYYLSTANGRFSSIPLFLFFTNFRFLLDHYYISLVFFLLLTYTGLFFFIRYIVREFYNVQRAAAWYHWLAAFSLLVLLVCMPEPATFFFWLATDTTYLIFLLLFLLYAVKLYQVVKASPTGNKGMNIIILSLLIVLLGGANEVSLFFSFSLFMVVFFYRVFLMKQRQAELFVLLLVHILTILLVLWIPGNGHRSGGYTQKQFFLFSAAGALYQVGQLFFCIFSNPVFWLAAVWALYGSRHLNEKVKNTVSNKKTSLILELGLLFVAVFVLCFAIRQVAGIVLPLRARNIIICIMVPALLAIAVLNGSRLPSFSMPVLKKQGGQSVLCFFGILLLLCNSFMYGLLQSVIDGPVHHEVINGHITQIKHAQELGIRKVSFNDYQEDFSALLVKKYGAKMAAFIKMEFPSPPRLLYFRDDPANPVMGAFYADYYAMDTILVNNTIHTRPGLQKNKTPVVEDDKTVPDY